MEDSTILMLIQSYDPNGLKAVMDKYGDGILGWAKKTHYYLRDDERYDHYIESLIDFRKNVCNGKFKYRDEHSIPTYLVRIMGNKIKNHLTQINNRRRLEPYVVDSSERWYSRTSADANYQQEERVRILKAAMEKLGPKCQCILQKFYYEGKSLKQIGVELGYTEDSAKVTKSNCFKKLRKIIKQQFGRADI